MVLDAEPHFAASVQSVGHAMIGMKGRVVGAAELRQIGQHRVRIGAVAEEELLIRQLPTLERRLGFLTHRP